MIELTLEQVLKVEVFVKKIEVLDRQEAIDLLGELYLEYITMQAKQRQSLASIVREGKANGAKIVLKFGE